MPENADFLRLTEMLLSRQDQQQQQLDRLAALAVSQDEINRRLDAGLAEAQATNRRLDTGLTKLDTSLTTLDAGFTKLDAGLTKLDTGLTKLGADLTTLDTGLTKLDTGLTKLDTGFTKLGASLTKTDEILMTFGQIQSRILDELEKLRSEQVRANRVQEDFAKRQDDFNIVFLEEIRHIKQDARAANDVKNGAATTVQEHEERLRRLEDFMNGFQSAA